jgi:hypothetical protein
VVAAGPLPGVPRALLTAGLIRYALADNGPAALAHDLARGRIQEERAGAAVRAPDSEVKWFLHARSCRALI